MNGAGRVPLFYAGRDGPAPGGTRSGKGNGKGEGGVVFLDGISLSGKGKVG